MESPKKLIDLGRCFYMLLDGLLSKPSKSVRQSLSVDYANFGIVTLPVEGHVAYNQREQLDKL